MACISAFTQRYGRNTTILTYTNVSSLKQGNQFEIHCICPGSNYDYFAVIRIQHMIRVTEKRAGYVILIC